ncbi:unnamed protein product, partial [Fusarium langsethiae]
MDGMHPLASDGATSNSPSTPICLKRKRKSSDQSPSPRRSPALLNPPSSFVSVDSDYDDDTPQELKVKQISAGSWSKQPNYAATHSGEFFDGFEEPSTPFPQVQSIDHTEPALCKEQQDLVNLIMGGRNVFYTGSAGSGKSTVLKAIVKKLRDMGRLVHIVAPTGRAALQVDGMSTWSYMGWTPDYHKLPISELKQKGFRKHVRHRINTTDVLIIDEISMVENHHFERINECMKTIKCWSEPDKGYWLNAPAFGGVQLIVTGDFCQLPPVKPFQFCMECGLEMVSDDEDKFDCPKNHGPFRETDKWAFKSMAWEEANFSHVNLQEIHRQSDKSFIKMLQKCRLGIEFSQDELKTLMHHKCKVHNATRLLCTRAEVSKVNRDKFNRMVTPKMGYKALDGFTWNQKAHPQLEHYNKQTSDGTLEAGKDHRLEPIVQLRAGMLIVLQVNLDIHSGLVNGSQGIIFGWEDFDAAKLPQAYTSKDKSFGRDKKEVPSQATDVISGEHAKLREGQVREFMKRHWNVGRWPRVHFHNGVKRTIYPWCVVNSAGDHEPYSLLYRTQIPLTAGWALSVHKSQGMTLDRVIVDLSRAFEEGQVYVALSRATSLEGLKVEGDAEGLTVGYGGNVDVREFLTAKFGEKLFLDHGGSTIGSLHQVEAVMLLDWIGAGSEPRSNPVQTWGQAA